MNVSICFQVVTFIISCVVAQNHVLANWTIEIAQRLVEGSRASNGDFFTFRNIQYGERITKETMFMAPQMASSGLKVTHYKSKYYSPCYQSPKTYTENYLKLNVSAKKNNVSKPVIAWLEGKEYSSLEMTTLFKNLVMEDIVVVTINYRISIFGFLCLGVPEAPGNAGLKDVILALQWIQENINKFGGDPKNVMLLGHGSGAAMVDLITMSPFSEDLVHKAFVISGSALAPWAISYDPIGYANIVAENLQYSGKSPMELAMKFKSTRLNVLLAALEVEFTNNTALFAPCVENVKLQNVFLNDTPINILKSGSFNHIPYVAAYTHREGTIKAKEFLDWRPKMESDFTQFIPGDLEFGSEINKTIAMNNIREFYFHNTTSINITEYLDYYRDTSVIVPLIRGVTARAETSTANVYLLEYAYHCISNADWPFNDISVVENGVKQDSRDNVLYKNMTKHEEDAKRSLINYIISFARTGAPNIASEHPARQWLPVNNETINYLYIGGACNQKHTEELKQNPYSKSMKLWTDLYDHYYKTPLKYSDSGNANNYFRILIRITILIGLLLLYCCFSRIIRK